MLTKEDKANLTTLPRLKAELVETEQFLTQLQKSKGTISAERHQQLAGKYEKKISELTAKILQLTKQYEEQKDEIKVQMGILTDNKQATDGEIKEIILLKEQQAISADEYKEKHREYTGKLKGNEKEIKVLQQDLDEIEFYLQAKGEVSYQKAKISDRLFSIKSIFSKINTKPIKIGVVAIGLLIVLGVVLSRICGGKHIETTSKVGIVEFTDPKTEEVVTIKVLDNESLQPLKRIKVKYDSKEGFEAFTTFDPEGKYFPEIHFYEHNSEHVIKMEKVGDQIYKVIRVTDDDQIRLIQRWAGTTGMCHVSERTYIRTIGSDELSQIGKRAWGFSFFFIKNLARGPVVYLLKTVGAFQLTDEFMKRELSDVSSSEERWDEYESSDVSSITNTFYLPSNAPRFEDIKKEDVEDGIKITWNAVDDTLYFYGLPDPTIYLGETEQSDLKYWLRKLSLIDSVINDWERITDEFVILGDNEKNDEMIELKVNDEVNNSAITRYNTVYQTVKIGNQWWMTENLKVTHYRNGDAIPNVTDAREWSNLTTGAYCSYDNDANNVATYGSLYNWYSVNDSRNIAPEGWHVPSDAEWQTLVDYLGFAFSGGKMKEAGTTHWRSPNKGATNESGFAALPAGGCRYVNGTYYDMGYYAGFWSSTESGSYHAWGRHLGYDNSEVGRDPSNKECGFSVRCVKD